jgi:hypothetical protein
MITLRITALLMALWASVWLALEPEFPEYKRKSRP